MKSLPVTSSVASSCSSCSTTSSYAVKSTVTTQLLHKSTHTKVKSITMPRGNAAQSKVHFQGKDEDFVVMVDDAKALEDWKKDRSIPLAQVVSGFKIFITHKCVDASPRASSVDQGSADLPRRHGAQGVMDAASKATLENEFGTSNEDDCMIKILERGNLQETQVRAQQASPAPRADRPCRLPSAKAQRTIRWERCLHTEMRQLRHVCIHLERLAVL